MDEHTARALIALNNRFYTEHAASFSATRSAPWEGWRRVVECAREAGALADGATVLDVACGNLRFEKFLRDETDDISLALHGVDSTPSLALPNQAPLGVKFRRADVLSDACALEGLPGVDLTVCFGFMHHVPTFALRRALLSALLGATRPGGVIAVSFWRFMDDERLARKAEEAEARAREMPPYPGFSMEALETGDHLLGWQNEARAFRYCHHADDKEIDELVASLGTEEIARFSADGASGKLNRYILLKRGEAC